MMNIVRGLIPGVEFTMQTTVTRESRREGHEECVECGK